VGWFVDDLFSFVYQRFEDIIAVDYVWLDRGKFMGVLWI
jgi:hypothetical protein